MEAANRALLGVGCRGSTSGLATTCSLQLLPGRAPAVSVGLELRPELIPTTCEARPRGFGWGYTRRTQSSIRLAMGTPRSGYWKYGGLWRFFRSSQSEPDCACCSR